MVAPLGAYNYTYGASKQENRQIQFFRTGAGPETIQARVFVLGADGHVRNQVATVPGCQINVEMQSTAEKTAAVLQKRALRPDVLLSGLPVEEQDVVIGALSRNRFIEVANGFGLRGFEAVRHLQISRG